MHVIAVSYNEISHKMSIRCDNNNTAAAAGAGAATLRKMEWNDQMLQKLNDYLDEMWRRNRSAI